MFKFRLCNYLFIILHCLRRCFKVTVEYMLEYSQTYLIAIQLHICLYILMQREYGLTAVCKSIYNKDFLVFQLIILIFDNRLKKYLPGSFFSSPQLIQWESKISLWNYLLICVLCGNILKLLISKLLCLYLPKYLETCVTLHSLTLFILQLK